MTLTKKINIIATLLSFFILYFLVWLIYYNEGNRDVQYLNIGNFLSIEITAIPFLNSIFNSISAVFIVIAILFIKNKKITAHVISIFIALFFSTLFLIFYILYHSYHGNTIYQGSYKPLYLFILITHILTSGIMLPLLLITLGNALFKNFSFHRKIAKYTYPIWLYVSVTGVVVYWFLKLG